MPAGMTRLRTRVVSVLFCVQLHFLQVELLELFESVLSFKSLSYSLENLRIVLNLIYILENLFNYRNQ